MLQQGLELFIRLRERKGLLASGGAFLHWRRNTKRYKQVGKLRVAHQYVFVKSGKQLGFTCLL